MCSIFSILELTRPLDECRQLALKQSRKMRHRGPDWSGIYSSEQAVLAHERLSIVDINTGAQPLYSESSRQILAVNGEIYNHAELKQQFSDYSFRTQSDCEVVLPLYLKHGNQFLNDLRGMFAFVLFNELTGDYLIARDPIGIIPLYMGRDDHGQLFVASEMKALEGVCRSIREFPPGHFMTGVDQEPVAYYQPDWRDYDAVRDNAADTDALHHSFKSSVHRHMMTDVPYGVLLSGGLDSSLVAAIAREYAESRIEENDQAPAWWPRLHSFAIGLEGSPDLIAAQTVADAIGTEHHGFEFTVQEGIDALSDVIYHIETYDVTTIRASTPMFLLARRIKAMGIKMVLSGEGADELFGGYLYFHKAPDAREFHEETVRKLGKLHQFDCLRANKSMAAWGVEARVPFLDTDFIDVAMRTNPTAKMITPERMEKHILRQSFEGMLPEEILWRQKEQFSDGVGYSWIDGLKDMVEEKVSDQQLKNAAHRFPVNTPDTKEGYYYRELFESHYPSESAARCVPGGKSVACSTPEALAWDESFSKMTDPSGRAVSGVHLHHYD